MKYAHFVCALLLLCFLAGGCALPHDQGRIVRAGEVDQLIESASVLPDHTYYFTGPEAAPDAIIAIDNRFALQSKYWIKVGDVAAKLKEWNRLLENDTRFMYAYEGFRIMTPDGQQAGIWYSQYDHSVVQFPDSSTIILYAPMSSLEEEKTFYRPFLGKFR